MTLTDFNEWPGFLRYYGGNAGRKICVADAQGRPWMLKFPEPTRGMRGNVASYTSSPLSEWLGSHIYESLGIPVHETLLGFREGKLVCGCRDFTWPNGELVEFHDLKNATSDDLMSEYETRPSDGRSLYLSDVLTAIEGLSAITDVVKVRTRFWDMFVVDALIGNADRNNENWGLLTEGGRVAGLAPVYDNGNAFFNKRRASTEAQRLMIDRAIKEDAVGGVRSCYLTDDGHHINPTHYIAEGADTRCSAAVSRVMERLDMGAITSLIDDIPERFLNLEIMNSDVKEFHKKVLTERVRLCLIPAWHQYLHTFPVSSGRMAEPSSSACGKDAT